jgi:SAM-dependent methyltransferase
MLMGLLPKEAFRDATVLDIGGGIGAIQHEAASRGAAKIIDVDASAAYLATARKEGQARGYGARARYVHGDFVELSSTISAADIVTLDRVVCCYPDASELLRRAAQRAKRFVGLVYPRDRWWTRLFVRLGNGMMRLTRNPFRGYIHPDAVIEAPLVARGFTRRASHLGAYWQVRLYERSAATAPSHPMRPQGTGPPLARA